MLNKPPPPSSYLMTTPLPPPQKKNKAEKTIPTLPRGKAYVVQFNPCWKFSFLFLVFTWYCDVAGLSHLEDLEK